MVTTRSHSERLASEDGVEDGSRKRKRLPDDGKSLSAKKKKNIQKSEKPAPQPANADSPTEPSGPRKNQEFVLRLSNSPEPSRAAKSKALPPDGEPQPAPSTISSAEDDPQLVVVESDAANNVMEDGVADASNPRTDGTHRRKHVRFGSEDPLNAVDKPQEDRLPVKLDEESAEIMISGESDDGEAPETVSTSQSHERARASAAGINKAIQSQERLKKDVRKKRDAQLKQQAKDASSKRTKNKAAKSATNSSLPGVDQTVQEILNSGNVPEFLPPEILNSDPKVVLNRPSEPSHENKLVRAKSSKRDENGPRDILRGGRVVRVLDKMQSSLPPKSSGASRDLREDWLVGRRSRDTLVASNRKPLHKGFLRK